MFADMVGYSIHLEREETENTDRAAKSIGLFKSLIGDYGGEVSNVSGDGILALFESAEFALKFSIQVQKEFRDQSAWEDGDPIQFRIGLNLGEVVMNEGSVQGHCVNVAARIQSLAEPNGIVVTAAMRSALREHSGLTLRSFGLQSLKNICEQVEVFAVESEAEAKPSQASRAPRSLRLRRPSHSAIHPWPCSRLQISQAIRETTICATESPKTSSPVSVGSEI